MNILLTNADKNHALHPQKSKSTINYVIDFDTT